jgi:hypothetical protein
MMFPWFVGRFRRLVGRIGVLGLRHIGERAHWRDVPPRGKAKGRAPGLPRTETWAPGWAQAEAPKASHHQPAGIGIVLEPIVDMQRVGA